MSSLFLPVAQQLKQLRLAQSRQTHLAVFAHTPDERQQAQAEAVSLDAKIQHVLGEVNADVERVQRFMRSPGTGLVAGTADELVRLIEDMTLERQGYSPQAVEPSPRV